MFFCSKVAEFSLFKFSILTGLFYMTAQLNTKLEIWKINFSVFFKNRGFFENIPFSQFLWKIFGILENSVRGEVFSKNGKFFLLHKRLVSKSTRKFPLSFQKPYFFVLFQFKNRGFKKNIFFLIFWTIFENFNLGRSVFQKSIFFVLLNQIVAKVY